MTRMIWQTESWLLDCGVIHSGRTRRVVADIACSPLFCNVHQLPIRAALCCHSNETWAPIANPPSSAQLGGTLYHSPKLHPGPCCNVGMRPRTDGQTHRRVWPVCISRCLRLTRNVIRQRPVVLPGCFVMKANEHWNWRRPFVQCSYCTFVLIVSSVG